MLLGLSLLHAATSVVTVNALTSQGFIGTYHVSDKLTESGRTAYDEFRWGTVVINNAVQDDGWLLNESLNFHCKRADVNSVYGVMVPHSEGGVVNNPADTDLYKPAKIKPGLIQGAARFSKFASVCPQMTGVIVDDFLQNYMGNESGCVKCPKTHPFPYGNTGSGEFCCPWPVDSSNHCVRPPSAINKTERECCILPGSRLGCQGYSRCGVNPNNHTACHTKGELTIALDDVIQIKCALMGRSVNEEGICDLSSNAQTPHLKLFLTWYTRFTNNYKDDGLLSGIMPSDEESIPIVDGISLWIEGLNQNDEYMNWTSEYHRFREVTDQTRPVNRRLEVYGGSYIEHSRIGILPPSPFISMMNQSIELYDEQELSGFFIFAGRSISRLNISMWKAYNLDSFMSQNYQKWVGAACGTVGNKPGRRVSITYGSKDGSPDEQLSVKNTLTGQNGRLCFGGWSGRNMNVPHSIFLVDNNLKTYAGSVQIIPGQSVNFTL